MEQGTRTVDELTADLARLGIEPGDTVMVHASLRAIGPVAARAAGVVMALERAVGEAGTLLMTLGARDDWAWVNERPESERPALLADTVPFDAAVTPAEPEIGVLAEVFRTLPGTVVSDHPEGRFGARGRRAKELVSDVPWNDYLGPGSPLERLVNVGGKVLRLGADIDTVTLLHYAEYLADLPAKRRVRRLRRLVSPNGPIVRTIECLDDAHGIVDYEGSDYFGVLLSAYLAEDRARYGMVGNARSELIDAADLIGFATAWMTEHLRNAR
ncbi:MAG TPA: AAC(3) family N-acetyltransferase [Labilithrix sp.]|nr:AAC(3) family N-acetyltransferase [Labilithrix sp.]